MAFLPFLLFLGVIHSTTSLMVTGVIPAPGEIQARRNEMAVMELQATNLERRGALLKWTTCGEGKDETFRFRTNIPEIYWNPKNTTQTYAITYNGPRGLQP